MRSVPVVVPLRLAPDAALVTVLGTLDVPTPAEAPVAIAAPAALTRGIIVGLGVSAPLWLGIFWLINWVAATLQVG